MFDDTNVYQYVYLLSSLAFLVLGIFFYTRTRHVGCIIVMIGATLSAIADLSFSFYDFLDNKVLLFINVVDLMSYLGPIGLLLVSLGLFLVLDTYTQQQK